MFSTEQYLRRIGVDAPTGAPTVELLGALQLAHLVSVPFENLHVYHHRGVRTDVGWSYSKIVEQQRGGWCFEVNGCFGALLRAVGFDVDYISCQVWDEPGEWGPPFDHLGLIVHVEREHWFVDVGFGDNCLVPLPLRNGEAEAPPRAARIDLDEDAFVLTELMPDGVWLPQLRGTLRAAELSEFTPRSEYLETTPDRSWSSKPFATRALDGTGSRVTLRADVLRVRSGIGSFVDTPVDPAEWSDVLSTHFALVDTLER